MNPLARVRGWGAALLGALGVVSMYRATLAALGTLQVVALGLSFAGLVVPGPLALVATTLVLVATSVGVTALCQRMLRLPVRVESALITAAILVFVLRPSLDPAALAGAALAGAVAALSKFVLAWRGRHVFNPAAVGAVVVTLTGLAAPAWWVGSPVLAPVVVLLGLLVLARSQRVGLVAVFLVVAVAATLARVAVQSASAGFAVDPLDTLAFAVLSTPFLFLGAFMLSEPLTLPAGRGAGIAVAVVVGVLAGWPPVIAGFAFSQEHALLVGNLLAFALAPRAGLRFRVTERERAGDVRILALRAERPVPARAGQYLELDVPHRRPDARGTRREFSVLTDPDDARTVRLAYRVPEGRVSSFKRTLEGLEPGARVSATGVWGDLLAPELKGAAADRPVLLVAAGIGMTAFASFLEGPARGRDVVVVALGAAALGAPFRDALERSGARVVVVADAAVAADAPPAWQRATTRIEAGEEGARMLRVLVPDLPRRHAYLSGPPAVVQRLAPALGAARSLRTDAFAGY